ncbi:hypothetical protein [Novacetimonas pomaceti]|nr:hypothetical protein [Novacetimonas pomaceti]MBV1832975.1 hypothetical protein [Novacetimonas pomaceti]
MTDRPPPIRSLPSTPAQTGGCRAWFAANVKKRPGHAACTNILTVPR